MSGRVEGEGGAGGVAEREGQEDGGDLRVAAEGKLGTQKGGTVGLGG